ncbi:3-oxoacyl-[acyl-carrier-protein] reductase (plasmid) [Azospirillum sp. B510]|uniref:SDR family oxidoreductase n=1 Tax=Azospirillum sp. (strain B510) TaxID=137722 RepID=UPI0001C4CA6D|nr:SDR family oxidoreductase [Azospirillum sp. B510]BAI75791.1 3-oxoacyl-[acyl-carrier-protein] reductase [Azospirillum sp. B510]
MTGTTPSNLAYLSTFSLAGQVALVTGAGRGLGLEIARALAGAGAHVLLNGRDAATLEARVEEIATTGGSASALAFDVSDRVAVRDAFARVGGEHGRLDVLVQNVGQRNRKPLTEMTDDEISTLLDIDLASSLILAREAARLMLPRGRGRLIAVTSVAGQIARANDSVYAAAKAGLNGMVRALAAEYGPHGLTSNAIAPGFFATETNAAITGDPERSAYFANRTPMRRWGRPEEIAGAAVFLASAAASYVNGHVLVVDGGATILM